MRIFLIGATGGIGHRLLPMLTAKGHKVVGLHRKPEQAEAVEKAGGLPVLGDIIDTTADDLASVARGCDRIVFSAGAAGSGLDRTTAIDGNGPIKTIAAARHCQSSASISCRRFRKRAASADAKTGSNITWPRRNTPSGLRNWP